MRPIIALILAFIIPTCAISAPRCQPEQIGGTGKGYSRAVDAAAESVGWWCPYGPFWVRVEFYSLKGYKLIHPVTPKGASPLVIANAYWDANVKTSDPENWPIEVDNARFMMLTELLTKRPDPIPFFTPASTATDGLRPAYTLSGTTLVASKTRVPGDSLCDCKASMFMNAAGTVYCKVTQDPVISQCKAK